MRDSLEGQEAADSKTFAELLKSAKDAGWEPTDAAIPIIEEKIGMEMRRSVQPAAPELAPPKAGAEDEVDPEGELETMAGGATGEGGWCILALAAETGPGQWSRPCIRQHR